MLVKQVAIADDIGISPSEEWEDGAIYEPLCACLGSSLARAGMQAALGIGSTALPRNVELYVLD